MKIHPCCDFKKPAEISFQLKHSVEEVEGRKVGNKDRETSRN